ncbi:hypothetical protein A0H81_14489 [Grifola frondosa]|uniref:Uncharacterized protein n=1 Tax=Grifola frondosa TaxID=5627 RepID=A0A1C7LL91_GRIFR|nr:hypothetical protein A0H81_14489 [Grifola frondosa]
MCVNPFPFYYRLPPPLSHASILSNPSIVLQRMDDVGLPDSRYMWPFYLRDTPLRCLYRMYEWAMLGRGLQVGYETQYFWTQTSWKVQDIPDPKDPDPVRYAILASFVETMTICFNERIDLGLLRMKNEHETSSRAHRLRTLSREAFKAITEAHHEYAPSWIFDVRGPTQRVEQRIWIGSRRISSSSLARTSVYSWIFPI